MILEIITSSFQKLWDKIGLSFISSMMAAVNPVFFLLCLSLVKLFNNNAKDFANDPARFVIVTIVLAACSAVFPTTFMGIAMNHRIAEGELVYIKNYFTDIPKVFKAVLLPSIILTVVYGAAAFLIGNGIAFYTGLTKTRMVMEPMLQGFMVLILFVSFAFLMSIQFVLIPYLISRKEKNYRKAFKFAASMCLAEFPTVLGIFLIDAFFFFLFTYFNGASLFLYYFISSYFRVYLFDVLVEKYPKFHA